MFFEKFRTPNHNDGESIAPSDTDSLSDMPSFEEHMGQMEKAAEADDKLRALIDAGYVENTPRERISEKINKLFCDNYQVHYRSGPFSDSTYFAPIGEDSERARYVDEAKADADRRYFSESAPSDNKQTMETILKKMCFRKELIETINPDLVNDGFDFYESGYFNFPEDYGLPQELTRYSFDLSDSEAALLAAAEKDDILANAIKMSMPPEVQEKILDNMPEEKYKEIILTNLNDAAENARYMIDYGTRAPHIIEKVEQKRKQIASAQNIIEELGDRDAIKDALSLVDINIYCCPEQREHKGIDRDHGVVL